MANTDSYKGIYAMHKYWGKKPFNEISKFIERYTDEGDTVLDSFCGSGVTLIEALKANRRCIGVDLNPIAILLTKVSLTAVDLSAIHAAFSGIREKLRDTINRLYTVEESGEKTVVTHTVWKNGTPVEVWFATPHAKKNVRAGTELDRLMATKPSIAPKWYPTARLFENTRINVGRDQTVADLFTPRALVGLSLLLDEINRIPDENVRNVFRLTFTGTLSQASNLVFVIRDRKKRRGDVQRAEVGSWVVGYWVPEEHFEINVWNCFENRFRRILKGENEIQRLFSSHSDAFLRKNVSLLNCSATQLPLPDASVDYVFIDPPHTNRILYLEQSLMWNAWLGLDRNIDWENEIVVSEAKERKNKNAENYIKLLSAAFSEINRVLKKDRFFSMAFNSLDDTAWIQTLNLSIRHGFEISDVTPLEYSATSVIQDNRQNALKTDFVLTFKNVHNSALKEITFRTENDLLKAKIKKLLSDHPDFAVFQVMNALFAETIPEGYIFRVSAIVKACAERTQ